MAKEITIKWRPQPRQETFLKACGLAPVFEGKRPEEPEAKVIGYGGAAGGGKTDSLLMAGAIACLAFPGSNAGFFRRKYTQLEGPGGAIMRSKELFSSFADWHGTNRRWTFPGDGVLEFCHADSEDDVYNYQSQQFDFLLLDEATHFTKFQYRYLMTRNRATVDGITPFCAMGTNPGNVGHMWFKRQFIDPGEPEEVHMVEVEPNRFESHIFIPAKLEDNQKLEERDPGYRETLEASPEKERRQLLEGDWSAFEGQFFPEWRRDIHTVEPFELPGYWQRFRALDYGLDCTACYWIAVSGSGQLYVYRELWQPDRRLSGAAAKIIEMTGPGESISYTVAGPDLWNRNQDTGMAGVEVMRKQARKMGKDFPMRKADNRRVEGWRVFREYLAPYRGEQEEVTAQMQIFSTCRHLISDIPALTHDDNNPDDAASEPHSITHGPEAIRYGVMSRPPNKSEDEEEKQERRQRRRKRAKPKVSSVTGY